MTRQASGRDSCELRKIEVMQFKLLIPGVPVILKNSKQIITNREKS
ncbi:MAG: hypothetical protein HQ582_06140 [Planctomycetes bacterium]|nr:hypothetical protein [Planctomycetota bacterium]